MFSFDITNILRRKLEKIGKKDKVLAQNCYKKIKEIISRNKETINTYKNLKSHLNEYKRIHLTDNYILLFAVDLNKEHIVFVDIKHWDNAYE